MEVLDSLPLGAMAFGDLEPDQIDPSNKWMELTAPVLFGPLNEWREHYPRWNEQGVWARRRMGDCYALVADSVLTQSQPFPGDEQYHTDDIRPELRFRVIKSTTAPEYIIHDYLVHSSTTVAKSLLEKPHFNIGRWYARQRSDDTVRDRTLLQHAKMGSAVAIVASKLLSDGIRSYYPSRNPQLGPRARFLVRPSGSTRGELLIEDKDLGSQIEISVSLLEDPLFDLIGWYMQYLERQRSSVPHVGEADLPGGATSQHRCSSRHQFVGCSRRPTTAADHWRDEESSVAAATGTHDDLPDLIALSNSDDSDEDDYRSEALNNEWFWEESNMPPSEGASSWDKETPQSDDLKEMATKLVEVLTACQPFPGDGPPIDPTYELGDPRFEISYAASAFELLEIYDRVQGFDAHIHLSHLRTPEFSIGRWYAEQCAFNKDLPNPWEVAQRWAEARQEQDLIMGEFGAEVESAVDIDVGGVQVDRNKYPALQRNSAQIKGNQRILPKPIVVRAMVNKRPVRALLDSGSLGDFISSTLVDQLSIKRESLDVPLSLQLAVQGSRSKVNSRATIDLEYQEISEKRTLDVININNYDLILGTPWMYQHQICLGFNPARVVVGSDTALPLKAGTDTKLMVSMMTLEEKRIDSVREELRQYAEPLCREMSETDLPPLRAINHMIPLIDESKTYTWRPSRCPEAFRAQWAEKRDAYIKSGRWKITSAGNTVPMLLIPKPGTNPPQLRTVVDLRERNQNTHKQTSPLPDMEGMLRWTASKPFRSSLDLKNAYEQIRIIPEHVARSSVTTPDGNMVSLVAQQGDCNAPATYQALMNYLFSSYIGRFMDIYLDDIVIYSDTLEEHIEHVKIILDVLRREKLYLSRGKMHFIQPVLKLLGRVIDEQGIRMDPDKVDSVVNWKVPTNRDLLRGFIGSVGYLADDIPNVRVPMGILSSITGDTVPFRWGHTEQQAFDEVKALVHRAREHRRVPLNYSAKAPPIWMVTDGCSTGISGLVSQGEDWKTAKIAAFYSAKLNPAQQNYPVHEIEMLAGIETMIRHADILQGVRFKWLTDHKGLIYLLNQKNLSGRQARWLEKISTFDFEVVYIPGSENVVADALSRLYANDSPGTVRAASEHTRHDVLDDDTVEVLTRALDLPVLAGLEARVASRRSSRIRRPTEKAAQAQEEALVSVSEETFVSQTPDKRKEGENAERHKEDKEHEPDTGHQSNDSLNNSEKPGAEEDEDESTRPLPVQDSWGIDILSDLKERYPEDPFFRVVMEKPRDFRNFESREGLIYLKENDRRVLCIPKVTVQGRSAREIVISEAHSMLAHLGASKNP